MHTLRYTVIFLAFFVSLPVFAFESKDEKGDVHSVKSHPPHDHPNSDHEKKLDEGLARKRKISYRR